jgi:hypothetical protein
MFTQEESQLILNILSQVTINAADPKAIETAQVVQSIVAKLNPTEEAK